MKDRHYSKLLATSDYNTCLKAGYIIELDCDSSFLKDEYVFRTLPMDSIIKNYKESNKKKIVLVATGSYAPIHMGHIQTTLLAKEEAQIQGYDVLGVILSPSHDRYVLNKYSEGRKFNIHERIDLINQKIESMPDISLSTFEGLYCEDAINFTTVLDYLDKELKSYSMDDVEIGYVCGGDNIAFSRVFKDSPYKCFVVERIGYGFDTQAYGHDNVIFVRHNNKDLDISSTKVRQNYVETQSKQSSNRKKYCLRIGNKDNLYFKDPKLNSFYKKNQEWFKNELCKILLSGLPDNTYIHNLYVKGQKRYYERIKSKQWSYPQSISLDSCIEGDYNLRLSRLFNLYGSQGSNKGSYVVGDFDIPKGEYWCFDDDYSTGNTFKTACEILKAKDITIKSFYSCTGVVGDVYDIVDLRDFLIGSENGGLFCTHYSEYHNQTQIRVPYVSPFVSLVSRAKVLPEHEHEVSKKIWQLNKKFYEMYGKPTRLTFDLLCLCNEGVKSNNYVPSTLEFIDYYVDKLNTLTSEVTL